MTSSSVVCLPVDSRGGKQRHVSPTPSSSPPPGAIVLNAHPPSPGGNQREAQAIGCRPELAGRGVHGALRMQQLPCDPAYAAGAKVDCGGKQTLTASGSTAQANAMTKFVDAYGKACAGQTLNYTANGSGAGINDFLAGKTDFGGSDTPLSRRPIRRRQTALRRRRRLEPARGIRPAGHHLQPRRRRLFGARRAHPGQDLQRHHHPLGRPGPHRAQRVHAGRGHPCHLPQRRIGHHRQLPVLPAGRIRRSLE